MSQEVLRVGVAGCGGLGRTEAKIVHDLYGVELVGLCDVILANAKQAAADLGIQKAYSNHRQLIEENDLDCMVVVTPTYTHAEVTVDAANAGLHVFRRSQWLSHLKNVIRCSRRQNAITLS